MSVRANEKKNTLFRFTMFHQLRWINAVDITQKTGYATDNADKNTTKCYVHRYRSTHNDIIRIQF